MTKPASVPNYAIIGPATYGCNTFSFYSKSDLSIPGFPQWGCVNGITIVFVKPGTVMIESTFTEFNTLSFSYGLGAHLT
jgi:hypothetical protein